jgi:ABC-type oligopeptide transport system substrate-binding subunit/class 3 adenylate cyclase
MQCPRCNSKNPQQAKFCLKCGARLVLACILCGTELPLDAEFCFACGTPVGAAPSKAMGEPSSAAVTAALKRLVPQEFAERLLATRGQVGKERRVVTMLFSDVKGSTAMAEDLDPEDWAEIMDGAFEVLIEPIYRYEGTLARLMGDAILAFFGAPIAHEDDPERACRAALEIIEGAQRYAKRLEEERGISGFNVRVGIHTGLVVVGEAGSDLRVEYTAMGDAINLAARMESAAEPGTVLISEDTHKLITPLFETEPLGPIQVKGRKEPVAVFRVVAVKEAPGKVRGIAGLESPLVGREAEFAALREAMERLQAGLGGVVTLVGDAGIGKSRLVAEARKRAVGVIHELPLPELPLQWVEGRCLSYGTSIAYLLWLDVLRAVLGVTVEDSPQTVRDTLRQQVRTLCPEHFDDVDPYLARLMSLPLEAELETALEDMDGAQLKANTFQAVRTLMQCAASERPLVLVCEDLHWADPTSIELLHQLLALTERVPLLILCVFRPLKEHSCWRFRELAAQTYAQRHTDLVLQPLSPVESQTLVSNLLRIEDLPDVLRRRILHRAEGNPFYVEEVIRSLIDRGAIVQDEATGRWTATRAVAEIPIPDTLQGVLMARIDRLQEEAKRVLQMASVIGRIFLYRVLAEIAEEQRRLDAHLGALQHEEMIRERTRIPELEYIFKHDLTREAAYNGLLKKERRIFHRQVGDVLETLFADRVEEQLGLLAHHWERAGDAQKATEYLLRAGDQARLLYAHAEAIDFYQRALAFLKEQGEHEQAARTLMKLGLTYHTAFDFQRSRQAYEEGFALWQRAQDMKPSGPPPPAPHELRLGQIEPQGALDPTFAQDIYAMTVVSELFSGLAQYGAAMEVVPDVARSWEVSEGGRKYVFHLRDDVRWSDGAPVTAHDFAFAWQRVPDPAAGPPAAVALYDVRLEVRALDAATLLVELEEPAGYFLHLVALGGTYPVPRHVVQEHGEAWTAVENIVTNGPFRLVAWQRGESMTLTRNPTYHGRASGNAQRVRVSFLSGARTEVGHYEADKLDAMDITFFSAAEIDRVRGRHSGHYVLVPSLFTSFLGFRVSRPPFDQPRVRRAFVMATDRETMVDVNWRGYTSPALGGFIPPGMPGHSAGIALPYDPEQARQLLSEAGYPGGRGFPTIELMATTDPASRLGSEYLQAQWKENLGINTAWEATEFEAYVRRIEKDPPHVFLWGWVADYPDPDNFLRGCNIPDKTGWRNEDYDRLVEEASRIMNQEQRMELYRQAERILIEQAAIMPVSYYRLHLLVKPWVRRYPGPWKDVIIEPH